MAQGGHVGAYQGPGGRLEEGWKGRDGHYEYMVRSGDIVKVRWYIILTQTGHPIRGDAGPVHAKGSEEARNHDLVTLHSS